MATVSFDFDCTLWDEHQQCFIQETVDILRAHLDAGDRVIIVTSRMPVLKAECEKLLSKFLKLELEVFCCPGNADDPTDTDPTKSDVLIAEKAIQHMDDLVKCSSLDKARKAGIKILFPPATKATIASMY